MEHKIIIDNNKHTVSTQFLTGKQIKIIANITEKDEALARAAYKDESMGWFVYKIIEGTEEDEQILDNDGVDLLEEKESKFYTACNGTYIVK